MNPMNPSITSSFLEIESFTSKFILSTDVSALNIFEEDGLMCALRS